MTVVGHTDQLGNDDTNLRLSRERADVVRAILTRAPGEQLQLNAVGLGSREPVRQERTEGDKDANRSVTVRVELDDVR